MWLDNFNHLRELSGFSLDELSTRSGVPKGTLSKISAGITKSPSIETIKSLVYAMGYTLADLDDSSPAFELSQSELSHVQKYRDLDGHGQKMVDFVLDEEHQRCKQSETPVLELAQGPKEIFDLYEFLAPVSAGFGIDLSDLDGAVRTKVISNVYTKEADFIVRVDGESMAPRFHHGDKLLVQETDDIEIGEIGIWYVNGKHYVKKKGEGRLISLNPKFPDVFPDEVYDQRCQGRVIGVLDPSWIVDEDVEK